MQESLHTSGSDKPVIDEATLKGILANESLRDNVPTVPKEGTIRLHAEEKIPYRHLEGDERTNPSDKLFDDPEELKPEDQEY